MGLCIGFFERASVPSRSKAITFIVAQSRSMSTSFAKAIETDCDMFALLSRSVPLE